MNLHNYQETKNIAIIGGGIVGSVVAWHLAGLGHKTFLIDPYIEKEITQPSSLRGSTASLGVLMGHTFRRSSGRGWELRQTSMKLWYEWIKELNFFEKSLKIHSPLIKIANSEKELSVMNELVSNRKSLGLDIISSESHQWLKAFAGKKDYGALISHNDGRINTIDLHNALKKSMKSRGVKTFNKEVLSIEKGYSSTNNRWEICLNGNIKNMFFDSIIVCTALGSERLLKQLGYSFPMQPRLGQALELKIEFKPNYWKILPGVLINNGINIIPEKDNKLIIGATLEEGITKPRIKDLKEYLLSTARTPEWIKKGLLNNEWYGLRAQPINRPSPILEVLEPGLILASGHYRNGILLAPATAKWIEKNIK